MSQAITREQEGDARCPALLEAARPEIYRKNTFRVTGLSVEAVPRDISRHTDKLRMMQKFGQAAAAGSPLALEPPPDEHLVRESLYKLHDPEKRLIDEIFWFWPHQLGQGKTDQVLAMLANNDIANAAKNWRQMEQSSESYVSMHNLAVLFHCIALDWELVALERALTKDEAAKVQQNWEHAFRRWKAVLEHEPFWSRLTARIRVLEDPRLTTGLARRIRDTLPLALLSINAALAVRFAEAGNGAGAARQLEIMHLWETLDGAGGPEAEGRDGSRRRAAASPVLGPLAQRAIRQAAEPIRQRIKSLCKNTESQADADAAQGDTAARNIIEQTAPLLAILDTLLPAENVTRDAAHDEVASVGLRCQVLYGNKTDNWKVSLELLERVLPIAAGQAVRERIKENIEIVKRNLSSNTCWFCGENDSKESAAIEVKMYGDVTRTPTWQGVQIQWRYGTVKVPRCPRCKAAHGRTEASMGIAGVLGMILGIGSCAAIVSESEDYWLGGVITFFILFVLGIATGAGISSALNPKGVKGESHKSEYPSVKELKAKGWEFGERPNTQ